MKKEGQLMIIALMLLVSAGKLKAQVTANAYATATIVTPLSITSNQSPGFETIATAIPAAYMNICAGKNTVTAADFTINAGIGDIYSITLPQTVTLVHSLGIERMKAALLTGNISQPETLNYGKQHIKVDAGLYPGKGQVSGKYSSTAFDVTVNFN